MPPLPAALSLTQHRWSRDCGPKLDAPSSGAHWAGRGGRRRAVLRHREEMGREVNPAWSKQCRQRQWLALDTPFQTGTRDALVWRRAEASSRLSAVPRILFFLSSEAQCWTTGLSFISLRPKDRSLSQSNCVMVLSCPGFNLAMGDGLLLRARGSQWGVRRILHGNQVNIKQECLVLSKDDF